MWHKANQTIREEHDERTELINLRAVSSVLAALSLSAFGAIFLLILLPLPDDQRFVGLGLTPVAMLIAGVVVDCLATRRHGPPSPQLKRAVMQRALLVGLPVVAGLVGGLADLARYGRSEHALRTGLALLLGLGLGLGVRLWSLNRHR
jgi:hypothetical protein